ncbi:hypothetical protein ACJX0J_041746, partial [Zea mays]
FTAFFLPYTLTPTATIFEVLATISLLILPGFNTKQPKKWPPFSPKPICLGVRDTPNPHIK